MVEAHVPDHDFDQAKINNAMTHVMILSAQATRNQWLHWGVVVDLRHWEYVHAKFWFQKFKIISNLRNNTTENCGILLMYLPREGNFSPPCTSPNIAQNPLSDMLTSAYTLRAALHLEVGPFRCVRALISSLAIGQKVEIGPNPFAPRGGDDLVVCIFNPKMHRMT